MILAGISTPGVFEIYGIEPSAAPRLIASGKEWLAVAGDMPAAPT